jgi:hypothetical protein
MMITSRNTASCEGEEVVASTCRGGGPSSPEVPPPRSTGPSEDLVPVAAREAFVQNF